MSVTMSIPSTAATSHSSLFRSHPSIKSLRKALESQEAYVHWYRTNKTSLDKPVEDYTEDADEEYFVEDSRYLNRCLNFLWNPRVKCHKRLKRIRIYRNYLQDIMEKTFSVLRWIRLPGTQTQVAVQGNYLKNYVWLITYLTHETFTTNKDNARLIRNRFEDVLVQAENVGIRLKEFFVPLEKIALSHSFLEEMSDIIQCRKLQRPSVEKKIFRLAIRPDSVIFTGNTIDDFSKLLIYSRIDCQVWSRHQTLTEAEKVDLIKAGLMEISDRLRDIKKVLKRPLKAFKAASNKMLQYVNFMRPTLVPEAKSMRNSMKHIMSKHSGNKRSKFEKDDFRIVAGILMETESHFDYVLRYGELLAEEIWDIIFMVRLCYNFIRHSSQNNIIATSQEAVLISKLNSNKRKKLLKTSNFHPNDFFKVDCPDTLRKLPIVVSPLKAEITLHMQGHRNSKKTVLATLTSNKFSVKRPTYDIADKKDEKTATAHEPNKLLFVSEVE